MRARRLVAALIAVAACVTVGPAATAAPSVSCRVGPAVLGTPRLIADAPRPRQAYVVFQVAQHGWWAGAYFDGDRTYDVVKQRPGRRPIVMFARRYQGRFTPPSAVGLRHGAVVANVALRSSEPGHYRSRGYVLSRHSERQLRAMPGWPMTVAVSVTDRGRIVGYLQRGPHGHRTRVVEWATPKSRPRRVPGVPARTGRPIADQAGDIAWQREDGVNMVRLRDGEVRVLDAPHPSYEKHAVGVLDAASGRVFLGQVSSLATVRWDLAAPHGSGPIDGEVVARYKLAQRGFVDAVGRGGAFVTGTDMRQRVFHTSDGRPFPLPREYYQRFEAINADGLVAFTAKRDRLVHLMTCN